MLALFEERARGLRKYIFELMTQKQTELEIIREEFKPRYEYLKERRAKGQISEDQYRQMIDRLSKEESDRKLDTELAIAELEQRMEEEMHIGQVGARAEAEMRLREKQVKEKEYVLEVLKEQHQGNETIQRYLSKEQKDA